MSASKAPSMAFVLITGVLHRDPIARTGKTGAPFVTAQLRYKTVQETGWASVIAFAEDARAELMRLRADDALTVQGEARLGTYTSKSGGCGGGGPAGFAGSGLSRRQSLQVAARPRIS
jgi:hypothetical protein